MTPAPQNDSLPFPDLWRSAVADLATPGSSATRPDEFPLGASLWPSDLDRRDFLKLLGGSMALAGLTGCGQRPEKILPYVTAPENAASADLSYYATAMPLEGYARGVLVESHFGRPTKIEGNPDHPDSLGATDAMTQAAVLELYDPDRSRVPLHQGQLATWAAFHAEWRDLHSAWVAKQGRGVVFLTEPTTSPTELRAIEQALDALPQARWYQHTPLARYDLDGHQTDYDFSTPDIVVSIDADVFYRHPAALRYARQFAQRRRVTNGKVNLNRLYAVNTVPTVTSALADFHLPLAPNRLPAVLSAIARETSTQGPAPALTDLTETENAFVRALGRDLRAHAGSVLFVAGPEQPDDVRRWALAMSTSTGSGHQTSRSATRSDAHPRCAGNLPELASAITRGEVHALLVLGANPAYTAPADLDFPELLQRVDWSMHLGLQADETAAGCTWHLPESHFLESWSDLRAYDGTATIVQPLIEPRFTTRTRAQALHWLSVPNDEDAYALVQDTWRANHAENFDVNWARWLNRGVVDETSVPTHPIAPAPPPSLVAPRDPSAVSLILRPDAKVLDGRFANNPWLQELPHVLTQLVWDNAAGVSPAFARKHGLTTGDLVELTTTASSAHQAARKAAAAVLVIPGHAPDCVSLSLGYGRRRAGMVGNRRGFDAYQLRSHTSQWQTSGLGIRRLDSKHDLVTTQGHFTMEARHPVRRVTPNALVIERSSAASLYDAWPRGRYAWGMSIDLSTCIGCKACVVACQAENNIPSVGKEQVARGREMHWLRVDRYFSGDAENPQMLVQPIPCMHCENAPCEVVCPVAATVHNSEGLNDMIYNRCIGTRYCSNNCPYKVRRFNFLDFRAPAKSSVHLQDNPDVTVRQRGVMEKCTYCVQRINAGRITAEKENRRVRDGEIKTACQQVCPVEAIIFGDLNDEESAVMRRKREPLDYSLLEELNTRPRTTYLAKVVAENNAPVSASSAADSAAVGDVSMMEDAS